MRKIGFTSSIRTFVKKTIGASVKFTPITRRVLKGSLTVFVFHDVSDHPSQFAIDYNLAVSSETFYRQTRWIRSEFNVIHPSAILDARHLPEHAAIVSFDDGFLGSFDNGLAILEQQGISSIHFLNMQAILEKRPILSALACFLDKYVPEFSEFAKSVGLQRPFHLTLSPLVLRAFEARYGRIDRGAVGEYQGEFANLETVRAWEGKELVAFGNHFYDHWNAAALSVTELEEQYKENRSALSKLKNSVDLFAFTNGQPKTCFSARDVALLRKLGAGRVFSSSCGVNRDPTSYVLGRLSLIESDNREGDLWYRIGRAMVCAPSELQVTRCG